MNLVHVVYAYIPGTDVNPVITVFDSIEKARVQHAKLLRAFIYSMVMNEETSNAEYLKPEYRIPSGPGCPVIVGENRP